MNLLLEYYINGTKAHDMPTVFIHSQKITSNDLDSKEPRSQKRLSFENSIKKKYLRP
jgi:hypothetical protein